MQIRFPGVFYLMCSILVLAGAHASQNASATVLDDYVARPDAAYHHELYHTDSTLFYTTYFLKMTSQRWRDESEVDRPLWEHQLQITVPHWRFSASPRTALLIVNGGSNDQPFGTETGELISTLAMVTGSVVAMVNQIPNQPLYFSDEDALPRSEDAILAYSLDKALGLGDLEWAVHLAMTKAVVRAMDSIQSWLAWHWVPIDDFIVLGGSKRGWTTWLTAAVDTRVKAMVPVSIDLLNMEPQFTHHWEALGFYAPAIQDYAGFDLPCRMRGDGGAALLQVIDPYEYRDRYSMPKLVINSAGDQFFLSDSSGFYFGALPGPKRLRYTFNTDHAQGRTIWDLLDLAFSSLAWINDLNGTETPPGIEWTFETDGSIRATPERPPTAAYLVQATNPEARDFRLERIGAAWTRTPLQPEQDGTYVAFVEPPPQGWSAFAIEMVFDQEVSERQVFTTDVRITPDLLPYAGTACQ
jgi:PhoPQ-activated pathogenicity-related protein